MTADKILNHLNLGWSPTLATRSSVTPSMNSSTRAVSNKNSITAPNTAQGTASCGRKFWTIRNTRWRQKRTTTNWKQPTWNGLSLFFLKQEVVISEMSIIITWQIQIQMKNWSVFVNLTNTPCSLYWSIISETVLLLSLMLEKCLALLSKPKFYKHGRNIFKMPTSQCLKTIFHTKTA